jgi:uncharacterized membrane protein
VILSEVGESRINGYLFVLERSLTTFLPAVVVSDAVREIESHLRERIAAVGSVADERATLEQILRELGPPLRVAQAYSAERTLDEAVVTGRVVPIVRAFWHLAVTSVGGFLAAFSLFAGYLLGVAFLLIAAAKPIVPNNVGFWSVNGPGSFPTSLGIKFATDQVPAGGYWIIPMCLFFGLGLLVLSHRGGRRFLAWWRERSANIRLPRVRLEVGDTQR